MRRAVILAGGAGTRLRPYTTVLPKPLMPVGDLPVLEIVVRQLRRDGFERVTITTGHLAELIEAFFLDGRRQDVAIDYFREEEPLGTVGALAGLEGLDDDFLVVNGDVLTDLSYADMLEHHRRHGAVATIATREQREEISLGVVEVDGEDGSRVAGYREKPVYTFEASMGIYCFSPAVLRHIGRDEHLDFPDLVLRLLEAGELVRTRRSDAYWLDIGRPEDYRRAQDEFERMRPRLVPG